MQAELEPESNGISSTHDIGLIDINEVYWLHDYEYFHASVANHITETGLRGT